MKALQFFGTQDLRFVDIPEPQINEDEVLMKVKKVGICGTDLHIYNGGMSVSTPLVLGHEFVGDIVKIGNKVTNIKEGDRAVAEHLIGCGKCSYCLKGEKNLCKTPNIIGLHHQGALAEYISIPSNLIFKLPQELSYDEGVLVEPLSIAVYAVRKAGVNVGDRVAVVGQGPIGLLVDFVAKASGGSIIGFDKHDNRIAYAKNHKFISKGFNITGGDYMKQLKEEASAGADIVFEAVGSATSVELAIELARSGGTVVILGVFEHDVMINMMNIVKKELQVIGSWTCVFSFEETMLLMKAQKLNANDLITHRYPFSDAIKAFQEASDDKENRIKSIIEFPA
jgi:2-desacetyl-2-hydroxyethyl bacteriochlorophyllide A dehydrogenase